MAFWRRRFGEGFLILFFHSLLYSFSQAASLFVCVYLGMSWCDQICFILVLYVIISFHLPHFLLFFHFFYATDEQVMLRSTHMPMEGIWCRKLTMMWKQADVFISCKWELDWNEAIWIKPASVQSSACIQQPNQGEFVCGGWGSESSFKFLLFLSLWLWRWQVSNSLISTHWRS